MATEGLGLCDIAFSVLAGNSAGFIGEDAGFAASVVRVPWLSATVVESAWLGAGADIGGTNGTTGAGISPDPRVNAIGGSKIAKEDSPNQSLSMPVHIDAHVESRENASIGGAISGSHGGPMVVMTSPLPDVLLPKPQVGQTRSLIRSGAKELIINIAGGAVQTAPIE